MALTHCSFGSSYLHVFLRHGFGPLACCNAARPRLVYSRVAKPPPLLYIRLPGGGSATGGGYLTYTSHGAILGCIRARRVVPEEATRAGSGDEGEEGGQAHRQCSFPFVFSSGGRDRPFFLCILYLFLCPAAFGGRRQGRPTRIDHFDLG